MAMYELEPGAKGAFGMIGRSPAMLRVYRDIDRVKDSVATVYIAGESGTGKELVAKALHVYGERSKRQYFPVNVTEFGDDQLLESRLFGIEKDVATGVAARDGVFVSANGGTLFLDEIAEMSPAMQVKLLRVLQERQVRPIGSRRVVGFDTRIVAASSRSLNSYVEEGRFRSDLFYRLNVVDIQMPPLRERGDDIILLADHFLKMYAEREGKGGLRFEHETYDWFMSRQWEGNVRELQNNIEGAVVYTKRHETSPRTLRPKDFKDFKTDKGSDEITFTIKSGGSFSDQLAEIERQMIVRGLMQCNGNLTEVAKFVGVNPRTIYRKLEQFEIDPDDFR